MKLATFNLFQFVEPGYYWYERAPYSNYSDADWQGKCNWIKQRLQAMDADVVGFQEVFSIEALRQLCQEAGYPYFATVDQPTLRPEDDRVYYKSVVALASRYPLQQTGTVALHPVVQQELQLAADFRFSRLPVYAELTVPELGTLSLYVVHLKSKRAASLDVRYDEQLAWEERTRDTLQRLSRGNVASMLQRGAEATLLYHSVSEQLARHPDHPVAILGDLNDDQDSTAMRALSMQERLYNIGGIDAEAWPDGAKRALHDYRLTDSFRVSPNMYRRARPFTHVHRGKGNTIDYILVSNALNPRNPEAKAEVTDYQVWNRHLEEDGVTNQLQSDHGQVCIELLPLRLQASAPNPAIADQGDVFSRQDFVDLAGGIYQSHKHFRQWSSEDKWDNFWTFFFDQDYGWVRSVYGRVPVDELYQKKRHSIEHIIPQGFLDEYLLQQRMPRHVRYGATVNPFNLAPSERNLNAKRSHFPFDMDGDQVVRPEYLKLQPGQHSQTGLDADDEWVIPSSNRGDIARSILYMLMVYQIDELYNRHIDTLVHWAKLDSPSRWEIAYNHWVYNRLGIRNPFIDEPEQARLLLDNRKLMHALQVRDPKDR
ncbi:MAG: endonuclease [Thiolinea sp.]